MPGKKAKTLFDHLHLLNAPKRYEINPTTKQPTGWPAENKVYNCVIYDKKNFEDWLIDK